MQLTSNNKKVIYFIIIVALVSLSIIKIMSSDNLKNILFFQKWLNMRIGSYLNDIKNGDYSKLILIIITSYLYGVIHGLGPGHGKAILASYFLTEDAQYRKGVKMSIYISIIHAISSVLVVLLSKNVMAFVLGRNSANTDKMEIISCIIIITIGIYMLFNAIFNRKCSCCNHNIEELTNKKKTDFLIALSVGMIPCPGILLFLFYTLSNNMLITGAIITISLSCGILTVLAFFGISGIVIRKKVLLSATKKQEPKKIHQISKALNIFGSIVIIFAGSLLVLGKFYT